ncbi:hypothetical protein D3C72_447180 [compost metagenome]
MTRASDVGATYVAQQRDRGVTWPALARMTGASEIDLRRLYGGLVIDPAATTPMDGQTAASRVRSALIAAGVDRPSARILARLWRANGGRMTAAQLTLGMMAVTADGGGDSDSARLHRVRQARAAAERLGIAFGHPSRGCCLSPAGLQKLSEMAGLKPSLDVAA